MSGQSSEELKQAIFERGQNLPLNNYDEEEAQEVEGQEEEVEEQEEPVGRRDLKDGTKFLEDKGRYEYPDERTTREMREKRERERQEAEQEAREAAGEAQEQMLSYLEGRVRESGSEEAFTQNFQNAQVSDFLDLRDRYSEVGRFVDGFATEYARGKIRISSESMQNDDNPHETSFLKWIGNPNVQRKYGVSLKDIENVIRAAGSGPPLRSKSKELMFPSFVHPKKGGKKR